MRRLARSAVAVVVLSALVGGACSGGDDDEADGGALPGYALALTGAEVHAVRLPPPPFPEDVKAAVLATLNTYLASAVVQPLRTGRPPGSLEALFTAAAAPRVGGPDRAALVEEGTPVSGEVRKDRASVKLTALTGPGGEVVVVAAQLDVSLLVSSDAARLAVVRAGDLALVAEGSTWRIDSYDLRTQRDSPPPPGGPR
ncbi:MAG: hypothetical protein M3N68_12395 [Actinomycetota bacterium]|nr:hypothetical protein [Actinomycetota bacterium]